MQVLQTYAQFTPASGESATVTAPSYGGTFALPAVDSNNMALAITNAGPSAASLNFGTAANLTALPNMPGLFQVPAGVTLIVDGAAASLVGTATYVAAAPVPGGSVLTFERGTTSTLQLAG